MESKLRENEVIIKTLKEGWHAVLHGSKYQWSKTMYRFKLFRNPVLTNQRLVLLKGSEIDYEVPLENIVEATHGKALWTQPYLRLGLKDGNAHVIVFECLTQKIIHSQYGLGDSIEAERITKEWAEEINLQIKGVKARQMQVAKALKRPPLRTMIAQTCPTCGQPLAFIRRYGRWYCYNCEKYR